MKRTALVVVVVLTALVGIKLRAQQVQTYRSPVVVAHKVGSNCTSNTCGACAVCVSVYVTIPKAATVNAIHCLSVVKDKDHDYPHGDLHEVTCGQDILWSIFEPPTTTVSGDSKIIASTFHNRSSDRDRDAQLTVDWH